MVVGANADFCLFHHPDPGFRGSLTCEEIISRGAGGAGGGGGSVLNKAAFALLMHHLLARGLGVADAADLQILFAYKLSFEGADLHSLAEALFENICCNKVCFVSEAALIASSAAFPFEDKDTVGLSPNTARTVISKSKTLLNLLHSACALVVDIGAHVTTIFPVYEGMLIRRLVSSTDVGGELCTVFMVRVESCVAV
jgi:hypothetical protein